MATPREPAPGGGSAEALTLALSPLLAPLRYAARVGVAKLSSLRQLESLVARAADAASPFAGSRAPAVESLAAAVQGFDRAPEPERRAALALLVFRLSALVTLPPDVLALAGPATARSPAPPAESPRAPAAPPPPPTRAPPQANSPPPAARKAAPARPAPGAIAPGPTLRPHEPLAAPVTALRGVGPALGELLEKKGLPTVGELLLFLPRRYEDRRRPTSIDDALPGVRSLLVATVVKGREAQGRRRRLEVLVRDDAGAMLWCIWFHYRQDLMRRLVPGVRLLLSGEVKPGFHGVGKTLTHPDLEVLSEERAGQIALGEVSRGGEDESFGVVVPVYTELEGIAPRTFRRIMRRALDENLGSVRDLLPEGLLARRRLLGLREAIAEAHFPRASADEVAANGGRPGGQPHRRLAFEEFFLVQLGLALKRRGTKIEPGIAFSATPEKVAAAAQALPWPLTGAQRRAVEAIAADMRKGEPMNRLLQGDVGSGKTAVALCAARLAASDGYQTALMAPTELLAEQHARTLRALLQGTKLHVELLVGGLGARERASAEKTTRTGAAQIVVGTHALAEENTRFHKLGLVIIDEQHRFGVLTRQSLMTKGHRPDTLVMTATPIPRTLALTLYGDLDVSVLDELPPGRTPVATKVFKDEQREKAYAVIRRELLAGRQAYIVLPLVEESEKLADLKAATVERERLAAEVFPGVPIGLVHGRQGAQERTAAMERFRQGLDRLLVATTVIEVGVDVPNASVMLIEHAERFGLSQLHQLRGRVGRGAAKSFCLLVTGTSGAEYGKTARERLSVMEETTDGFRIAEADLELRGPGEFLGTRQSGLPEFAVARLAHDQAILAEAREEAFALIERDPELALPENQQLRRYLFERWRGKLSLARVA